MRNHKTGCGRCHRKVCCCPRPTTSCICPPGPPGPQGPPGPPGSNGSSIFLESESTFLFNGQSDSEPGVAVFQEYAAPNEQTLTRFTVNIQDTMAADTALRVTLEVNGLAEHTVVVLGTGGIPAPVVDVISVAIIPTDRVRVTVGPEEPIGFPPDRRVNALAS